MKNSVWNEFRDLAGVWEQWLQNVSLTEEESEAIRNSVLGQNNDGREIRLSRQIARINRMVAFANRSAVPRAERYRIYTLVKVKRRFWI